MEHNPCHDHGCCCHDHTSSHSCCHSQPHSCCGSHAPSEIILSHAQAELLARFAQTPFLPLVRFLYHASQEEDLESIGLSAVYLETGNEALDQVKATAALLEALEEKQLITLDYDIPLSNYDYSLYKASHVYGLFQTAVAEGAKQPGFLFDTPDLEMGSMALTALGQEVLEQL